MSKIIGVHGFTYPAPPNALSSALFYDWQTMLDSEVDGFGWYSSPLGPCHLLRAWLHGEWNRYRYAYQRLAVAAAVELAAKIVEAGEPVSIVCHSLGSRVVLKALAMLTDPKRVERVLILDGAELQASVPTVGKLTRGPTVLNVCNRSDNVLKDLGSRFAGVEGLCIGYAGLGSVRARWRDVFIDDAETQKRVLDKRGWDLEGNAVLDLADHCTSYRHKGNWPLYRAFMKGDPLNDLTWKRATAG